jgi:hypothetical protein
MKSSNTQRLLPVLCAAAVAFSACATATVTPAPTAAAAAPAATSAPATAVATVAPQPSKPADRSGQGGAGQAGTGYNTEQAISDRAQLNTIAFDALGFLTGTIESDSFFPPGKVADFWGFQYLRDNDPSEMGHNTDFLTNASLNMLNVLTSAQRRQLIALAKSQVTTINDYGYKRFVFMKAFRLLLEGNLPSGTTGLKEDAVKAYSAQLYEIDNQLSYARAKVFGPILASLSTEQKANLDAMVGKGMKTWPDAAEPAELRTLTGDEKVAVMTYGGDLYSWYAGDVEADTYFCPERHGTYFGSFYLKDAPAVGNPDYTIDTTITGNLGASLLAALDTTQSGLINGLIEAQRSDLDQIVATRRAVATELRKFIAGGTADQASVTNLMKTYGELDGSLVYRYAVAFSKVGQSLTDSERAALTAMRAKLLGTLAVPKSAYLYSRAISLPSIPDVSFLFS